jgi:hypothetical protein
MKKSGFTLVVISSFLLLNSAGATRADDARDYLIQKVCVDAKGNVLPADPYSPPPGASLRNLKLGENFPYYKHDQPTPGYPNGHQRHDSYPALDKEGNEIIVNPFYFDENYSGNGFDIYMIRGQWVSAGETQDGGGFSTTFFGEENGKAIPYNGWVFFPLSFFTDFKSDNQKVPITGRYWEHAGEPWHSVTPTDIFDGSETSWSLTKSCSFGGINGSPVKKIDAIQSVHGYVSKGNPLYESNMKEGHLEVFYFTKIYGVTRWEDWAPVGQLNNYDQPSELRNHALITAKDCAKPIPEVGQWLVQPTDLPSTKGHQILATTYSGQDGIKHMYVLLDVRDWSGVTILNSPQPPPPCPNSLQNLLENSHFDNGTLKPWLSGGTEAEQNSSDCTLMQSKTATDTQFAQNGSEGGVRYLALQSSGREIHQDVPVGNLKNGVYKITLKLRPEKISGTMRIMLQQVDANGKIVSTDIDVKKTVNSTNSGHHYDGVHDAHLNASVYLASTLISRSGRVAIHPETTHLRFVAAPQSEGTFDLVDANLSVAATGAE